MIGGALVDAFWWGAAFLPAVPVAAIVLGLGPALLPEHADPDGGALDPASVALSLAAIVPVIYAVKHAAADRPGPGTLILALIGLVAALFSCTVNAA